MPVIDEDREEKNKKSLGPSASSKTKDLSHVPCKFYKVGSCTAGSSCPFSHSAVTTGAQKDVCAWFVKGNNCKFGHKCALAHIMPGQSMSMDRKNKKLAQQQAQAGKEGKEGKEGREGRDSKEGKGRKRDAQQARPPTMSLKSLKASISPSAPAPALDDTDFASFSALELDKLPNAPAINGKPQLSKSDTNAETITSESPKRDFGPIGSPPRNLEATGNSPGTPTNNTFSTSPYNQSVLRSPSGAGAASGTARTGLSMNRSTSSSGNSAGLTLAAGIPGGKNPSWGSMGNGSDIGSLPSLPSALLRPLNGIQPHSTNPLATSGPRSGGKDFDLTFEYDEYLGNGPGRIAKSNSAVVIEDNVEGDLDNLDDFLPSSLTDLLTPEERKRRMSRSSSQQDTQNGLTSPQSYNARRTLGVPLASRVDGVSTPGGGGTPGHRYSRSVPMSEISHLWANQDQPIPSPNSFSNVSTSFTGASPLSVGGLATSPPRRIGNGTPGSFTSASGRLAADDYYPYTGGGSPNSANLGLSGLNPSNASAAFLPGYGIGSAYIKAKREREAAAAAANLPTGAQRSVSGGILTTNRIAAGIGLPGTSPGSSGMAYGTPRNEPVGVVTAGPFGLGGISASRDIGGMGSIERGGIGLPGVGINGMEAAVSPSTRAALQNHAPGQSLPQGLAAGLSRIHAKTSMQVGSLTSVGSPPVGSAGLSPGFGGLGFYSGPYGTNRMPSQQPQSQPQVPPGLGISNSGTGTGIYGQQQYGTHVQQASGQQSQMQQNLPMQSQVQYTPSFSQGAGTLASGSSELDAMLSKLSFTPQPPSTQASAPKSYAGAAAARSTSSSGMPQQTAAVTTNISAGHDDDLFDMDEEP